MFNLDLIIKSIPYRVNTETLLLLDLNLRGLLVCFGFPDEFIGIFLKT